MLSRIISRQLFRSIFAIAAVALLSFTVISLPVSGQPCWPDNVFSSNYNLFKLGDLEEYITKNKHLPNIPSVDEVTENGVELGDMQAKLLQKIEELTLYIIQLQKENQEIKKLIKQK